MRVLHQVSVALLAGALVTISNSTWAQNGRSERDDVRRSRVPTVLQDGRWDDDRWDGDDDRRRSRPDARPGRRRGQDEEWLRRHRGQREEWCRRHRDDRRCDDLFRRDSRNRRESGGGNWCWDVNRDGRCDAVDNRRRDDRSGVWRGSDRGPEWERWLRANGVDVNALIQQPR